jgi:hypothetical protein
VLEASSAEGQDSSLDDFIDMVARLGGNVGMSKRKDLMSLVLMICKI